MYYVKMGESYGEGCCLNSELCSYASWNVEVDCNTTFGKEQGWESHYVSIMRRMEKRNYPLNNEGDAFWGRGETPEEAWKNCLMAMEEQLYRGGYEEAGKQNRFFWFKRPNDLVPYEFNELRELIRAKSDTMYLGEHVNANTGNLVEGYMVTYTVAADETFVEDEEEYED